MRAEASDSGERCHLQAKAALVQVQEAMQENTPEELTPLVDALDRAKRQQEEATGIREALEAEVRTARPHDFESSVCLRTGIRSKTARQLRSMTAGDVHAAQTG